VAKGKDFVAQRIKEEARKYGVEMVENRPLAQALYVYCDIGDAIPKDMYKAVAEVLATVYRIKHPNRTKERAAR
jgi:flagellar biosynthetic protein FlhB